MFIAKHVPGDLDLAYEGEWFAESARPALEEFHRDVIRCIEVDIWHGGIVLFFNLSHNTGQPDASISHATTEQGPNVRLTIGEILRDDWTKLGGGDPDCLRKTARAFELYAKAIRNHLKKLEEN